MAMILSCEHDVCWTFTPNFNVKWAILRTDTCKLSKA